MSDHERFNLRVYAIITNERNEVLISDECRNKYSFTKFPGGGLEHGEGLVDCVKRELKEELDIDASIGELFYVNDFHQVSAFRSTDQLISFYFRVESYSGVIEATDHTVPVIEEGEKFRWVALDELTPKIMTFPIDKAVIGKLKW